MVELPRRWRGSWPRKGRCARTRATPSARTRSTRNPVNEDEEHSQEGWSVVEAKLHRASPREPKVRSPATPQLQLQSRSRRQSACLRRSLPVAMQALSWRGGPRVRRVRPSPSPNNLVQCLRRCPRRSRRCSGCISSLPWEKPFKHYLWATQMSVLELHSRLSSHREAFLEQVNELWKNVNASLKENAPAVRLR